ncbi:MAG: oligopeptide transporter, OPT family [Planctomycetota bacterium]|nr:MAG: oligopeptide transporter, OPT family [Planctomycetota bacterium]
MAAQTTEKRSQAASPSPYAHEPYVPDATELREFTWGAVLAGVILGIVFGASSLYLVLKIGMTVSASIPVAVLSITLFRVLAKVFRLRPATILENNIVQTTGSAGESIAFGLGVTIPALLLLGHDMTIVRVMTVGCLGGLLGILMMIPLRRAFIVQQHGKLRYPEGTACAEVLIVGEEGGATARTVFVGFGLAFIYKFCMDVLHLWKYKLDVALSTASGRGLRGGVLGGEVAPELLGVGYIIGPRIASIMVSGGVLAYLVIAPMIVMFGDGLQQPLAPATEKLISEMSVDELRDEYILFIGAGAVATGGIISMFQALPLIFHSIRGAMADLAAIREKGKGERAKLPRTERDMPLWVVVVGSLALIVALAALPQLGLGLGLTGFVGGTLIVLFGFLFVTVSSRLTGEIGSSSNPISGMTVATLLLTCLVFVMMGNTDKPATLTALTIAAVVCIAASNGGTTSQDLKTGYLVGGTPWLQQVAILIGALTSALVIGLTLQLLNDSGTVYTRKAEYVPNVRIAAKDLQRLDQMEKPGGAYADEDDNTYHVLLAAEGEYPGVPAGKYLVNDQGLIVYMVDPAINGRLKERDDGTTVTNKLQAPKTRLMAVIIDGILNGKLPWELVILGALISIVLELAGVSSLPFAVGVYLPLQTSVPIFIGGMVRYAADKLGGSTDADSDSSPAVLLSSGYIAGGSIAGVLIGFLAFKQEWLNKLNLSYVDPANPEAEPILPAWWSDSPWPAAACFAGLVFTLFLTGVGVLFRGALAAKRSGGK